MISINISRIICASYFFILEGLTMDWVNASTIIPKLSYLRNAEASMGVILLIKNMVGDLFALYIFVIVMTVTYILCIPNIFHNTYRFGWFQRIRPSTIKPFFGTYLLCHTFSIMPQLFTSKFHYATTFPGILQFRRPKKNNRPKKK